MSGRKVVTSEMEALDNKVRSLVDCGYKNREICLKLNITYEALTKSLRRIGYYKGDKADRLGAETNTVAAWMDAKMIPASMDHAQVKEYFSRKEGKKYSDVSEFYGL